MVDDYTVKIVTKNPFAPLLVNLASPSHNFILPKEAEEKYGDFNKAEAAIGTGPFILERYERGVWSSMASSILASRMTAAMSMMPS